MLITTSATSLSATALIAAALIPGAHADSGYESAAPQVRQAAIKPQTAVTAAADLEVDFSRSFISSKPVPDPKPEPDPAPVMVAMAEPPTKLPEIPVQRAAAAAPEAAVTEDPAASGHPKLRAPMAELTMTSPFGERKNPLTGEAGEVHTGLDFGSPCNTPIAAAAAGTVVEAGWHPYGGGKRIVIDHGAGLETTYNHLAKIDVDVGQSLPAGNRIAAMGTTGNSTGCHLHFEVVMNDQTVDPADWLF